MWNEPTKEHLAMLRGLYETESVSLKDKLVLFEPLAEKELSHDTTQAST